MIQTLFDDIKAYFDAKENPTEQEQQFKRRLSDGYSPITSVHRDDLKSAGDILNFPKATDVTCPKCNSEKIRYDIHEDLFHCDMCSQTWNDKRYVLVEFPEDASSFEEAEIGYPSWDSEDNGARYVPEQEYIREFGKSPEPEKCYRPVGWPDSQKYMGKESCELIQDEDALEAFGSSAYWVPFRYTISKS